MNQTDKERPQPTMYSGNPSFRQLTNQNRFRAVYSLREVIYFMSSRMPPPASLDSFTHYSFNQRRFMTSCRFQYHTMIPNKIQRLLGIHERLITT